MCAKQVSRSEGQKEVQKEWRRHMQRLDSEIVKQVYKASMFISIWKGCWRWKKERRGIYPNQKFQGRFPKGDDDWVRSGQLRMTHWKKKKRMTHEHYQGWNRSPAQAGCMRRVLRAGALGRPRGMGWGGKREGGSGWGTHVNPWLIHVNVWQKPLQYCKVISLQLIKINAKKKKKWPRWTGYGRGTCVILAVPQNPLPSKAAGPTDSADVWARRPCAAGGHCDAGTLGTARHQEL